MKLLAAYLAWLGLAVLLPLLAEGLAPKNVTLLCAQAFLGLQLALRPTLSRASLRLPPGPLFLGTGVLAACFLEAFHMISQPFDPALLVTRGMGAGQALSRLGLDLLFTVPAYLAIFWVIWRLIGLYRFSAFEYFILVSLGQALGDGGLLYFLAAPHMLLFLPYTVVKYQAMNLVPYLLVRERLQPRSDSGWRFIVPVLALVATYFLCGAAMKILWRLSPWGR
jgi:hypothetical protein